MTVRKLMVPLVLSIVGLVLASSPARSDNKEKLADVTKKDLASKVPNFFCFGSEDDAGSKRLWLRVDGKHFVERYPSGAESKFKILGRTKVDGVQGTVLAKVGGDEQEAQTPNDGSFQAFIPDLGSAKMEFRFRTSSDGDWMPLTEMKKVE
jgi:hypothetical protein